MIVRAEEVAMSEPVTVSLADHWRVYLDGLVKNRRFESVDDAIESSLRLLEATEHADDRLARMLHDGEQEGGFEEFDYDGFLKDVRGRDGDRKAA